MSGKFDAFPPMILICFVFEVCPLKISTALLETLNFFAKTFINSAFAAPSTGSEAILIFNAPLKSPTISLFDARGTTRTLKIKFPSFSVN